jgi:hypothetical protein
MDEEIRGKDTAGKVKTTSVLMASSGANSADDAAAGDPNMTPELLHERNSTTPPVTSDSWQRSTRVVIIE